MKHARLKGTEITLSQAQAMMGSERTSLDDDSACYPGDIVGIPNQQGLLAIGDTLYTGSERISCATSPPTSEATAAGSCRCP